MSDGPLPDRLGPGMAALFVGFNPGLRSGAVARHYAGRGNQFWRLLAASGLTPRLLRPDEDGLLPGLGLGLTNLVARPTASAAELPAAELRAGVPRLRALVGRWRPRVVAYAGKGVYLAASGRARASWGAQQPAGPARTPGGVFEGATDFVLPSPSGLARLPFAEKLRWYRGLADLLGRPGPDAAKVS